VIKLRVYGTPAPQGSKSAFAVRKAGAYTGRVAIVDDNKGPLKSWRQAVVEEGRARMGTDGMNLPAFRPMEGPLSVTIVFMLARPASHRTPKGALRASAPARPAGQRMDLDKLARSTLDALTAAGVWTDDGQVADLNLSKVYAAPGEAPGAVIEIGEA
jgi:Holliday junction resolvase RusA-like endonuclease